MKQTKLILSAVAISAALSGCQLPGIFYPGGGTPHVSGISPSSGDTNIAVGYTIAADLSLPNGPLNLSTVNQQSVTLTNAATGAVVATNVQVNNDAEKMLITPAGLLDYETQYTLNIKPSIEDEAGKTMQGKSISFTTVPSDVPSIQSCTPLNGEVNVDPANFAGVRCNTTGNMVDGVDSQTMGGSVQLFDANGASVSGTAATSGGDDTVNFNVDASLSPNTTYTFTVSSGLHDNSGASFAPYTSSFTTGGGAGNGSGSVPDAMAVFQQGTRGVRYTSLAFGPDGMLYALRFDAVIVRFPIEADGSLGAAQEFDALQKYDQGLRFAIGMAFTADATAANPDLWITTSSVDFDSTGEIAKNINDPWAGKLLRVSGPNLDQVEAYVEGLPRSSKDHLTNSVAISPNEPGVVYLVQGSNTAMGAPDSSWNYQPERALTGAVLRVDTNAITARPLNVQTEASSSGYGAFAPGPYDPFAAGAPVTVYASGTRNSYDLVWHSNGNLYVPANGSAAGGNAPMYNPIYGHCDKRIDGKPYTGPQPQESDMSGGVYTDTGSPRVDGVAVSVDVNGYKITNTLKDYLFKIEKGGYYGTPNPKRCEWVLNGGSTGFTGASGYSVDGDDLVTSTKVGQYASSITPDPNYRGPSGSFGVNVSPNGAVEYKGDAFSGLTGNLIVTRYSSYDDLAVVKLGSDGNAESISSFFSQKPGWHDPLDVTVNPATGYLYVALFDSQGGGQAENAGLVLVRPQ